MESQSDKLERQIREITGGEFPLDALLEKMSPKQQQQLVYHARHVGGRSFELSREEIRRKFGRPFDDQKVTVWASDGSYAVGRFPKSYQYRLDALRALLKRRDMVPDTYLPPDEQYLFERKIPVFNATALESLKKAIKDSMDRTDPDAYEKATGKKRSDDALPELLAELSKIKLDVIGGGYYQHYCGRIFHNPYHGTCNIQALPQEIRAILFEGYWDYDIDNCHPSIILQLARRAGVSSTQHLQYYLDQKSEVRSRLAHACGVTEKQIKRSLLAVTYGARITSPTPFDSIPIELGYSQEAFEKFAGDPFVVGLKSEVDLAAEKIVGSYTVDDNILIYGRTFPIYSSPSDRRKRIPDRRLISTIALHHESEIMLQIYRKFNPDALIYDGFLSRADIDQDELSAWVKQTTSLDIRFSKEQLRRRSG